MCYLEIVWHTCIKGISLFKNEVAFHASWVLQKCVSFPWSPGSLTAGHGVAAQWSKGPLRDATKQLFNVRHFHHTETLSESNLLLLEDFVSCQCLIVKSMSSFLLIKNHFLFKQHFLSKNFLSFYTQNIFTLSEVETQSEKFFLWIYFKRESEDFTNGSIWKDVLLNDFRGLPTQNRSCFLPNCDFESLQVWFKILQFQVCYFQGRRTALFMM